MVQALNDTSNFERRRLSTVATAMGRSLWTRLGTQTPTRNLCRNKSIFEITLFSWDGCFKVSVFALVTNWRCVQLVAFNLLIFGALFRFVLKRRRVVFSNFQVLYVDKEAPGWDCTARYPEGGWKRAQEVWSEGQLVIDDAGANDIVSR